MRRRPRASRACRTSSRPTTRRRTSRASSRRRSSTLPAIAETFEIIAVNDGSRDRTQALADELTARHPGVVRAVHHPTNLGYGARAAIRLRGGALRAGRVHRRRPPVPGRGRRPADRAAGRARTRRTSSRATASGVPTRSSAPCTRALYRLANRIFFGLAGHRRRLRLQAVPARGARRRPGRVGGRLLLGRAADQAPGGRSVAWSRSACRTTRARPARRPAPSRRSSCAPFATSGGCGCDVGEPGPGARAAAGRSSRSPSDRD